MDTITIDFGKYKGNTVKHFINDKTYCKWLINQEWFMVKYNDIYNIIKKYENVRYHDFIKLRIQWLSGWFKQIKISDDSDLHKLNYRIQEVIHEKKRGVIEGIKRTKNVD